ncbi:MAG: hypothetical protein HY650_02260 [Acidobacteria bacterium]|nr:hypothetical protein [Acidobacteriota bacterium]
MPEDLVIEISNEDVLNTEADPIKFYGALDNVITREVTLFIEFVMRCLMNCLYFQGLQFDSGDLRNESALGTDATGEGAALHEGWYQQNYYQAFLTMKQALLMDVNPVPQLKGSRRPDHDPANTLMTRQAIECLLDEAEIDSLIPEELLNTLLFATSWRFTMPYPSGDDDQTPQIERCPDCEVVLVDKGCPLCQTNFGRPGGDLEEEGPDQALRVESVIPWWVLPIPMTAKKLRDVGILVRTQVLPRHSLKEQLEVYFPGLESADPRTGESMKIDIDPWDPIADEPIPEDIYTLHMSSLGRLFRLSRKIIAETRTFGMGFPMSYGSYSMGSERRMQRFYVQIWVRGETFDDCHGDLVLHFLEGKYIGQSKHRIDDHWTPITARMIPGRIYGDGEDAAINNQDAINNLLSLGYMSAQTRSYSRIFMTRDLFNLNDLRTGPNTVVPAPSASAGSSDVDLSKAMYIVQPQAITGDVKELRDQGISFMQTSMGVFPVLFGQLPPGVEAWKAIETLRANTLRGMRPWLTNWYAGHQVWTRQGLKLSKTAWKRKRNSKLNNVLFKVDPKRINEDVKFKMEPSLIIPTGEQDKRQRTLQGLQLQLIDPTDPLNRVQLLTELGLEHYEQALLAEIEAQSAEIEEIIETRRAIPISPKIDNHLIHYFIVRYFLRSDYGRYLRKTDPMVYQLIETHGQIHAFIADGKIEEAINEMVRAGILDFILSRRADRYKVEDLKADLELIAADMAEERKRMEMMRTAQAAQAAQGAQGILQAMAAGGGIGPPPPPPLPGTATAPPPLDVPPGPPPGTPPADVLAAMGGVPPIQ